MGAEKSACAGRYPLEKPDLAALAAWGRRQDRDSETILASSEHRFGHGGFYRLALDAGKTRPTTGLSRWDIQGNVVTLDNAEIEAKDDGTLGYTIADAPADTYVKIEHAISSDEDGNFDVALYVSKDPDNDDSYLIVIDGNTTLDRQLEIISVPDTFLGLAVSGQTLTLTGQRGENEISIPYHLPDSGPRRRNPLTSDIKKMSSRTA